MTTLCRVLLWVAGIAAVASNTTSTAPRVNMTTTIPPPKPLTTPPVEDPNDNRCGWVIWGREVKEKDVSTDMCNFYKSQDIMFVVFLVINFLVALWYFGAFQAMLGGAFEFPHLPGYWRRWFRVLVLVGGPFLWEIIPVYLLIEYVYHMRYDAVVAVVSDVHADAPPGESAPPASTATPSASRFSQSQFTAKITPGDCRSKYSRVQTNAC
jgi:hypothetical protein